MLQQFTKDESRQEEAIPKRVFVEKEISFIKYTCLHKRKASDYFSKTLFFSKIRKNKHMSIFSQGTDTVDKKLAVFTYVYFFVTEAQKSSKNKNKQPQLKNFTGSYIKTPYIISG